MQELPGEDRWYVLIDEQQYGPFRLGQLRELAGEGRLLEGDWIWKSGLASWIAAKEVPGAFVESTQFRAEEAQLNPVVGQDRKKRKSEHNFKKRAKHQIESFALMFVYLWIVFGLLAIHESIILSQHQINYQAHGVAVINALIFAKVMLIAEDMHLGQRFNDAPLIYSVILKSLLFGIALICFHIVEQVVIGMWDGKTIAESISEVGADKLAGMVCVGIISTVALVPYFILREINRVIGGDNFRSLFFQRRSASKRGVQAMSTI
jgi:hypothetical protein